MVYKKLYAYFGHQAWWPGDSPFEIVVGAILTQNTNWTNVEKAINNLKKHDVLCAKKIFKMSNEELAALIIPAGYFNVKAKRLKAFISHLILNYKGSLEKMFDKDIFSLRQELLSIYGIGPETADSILLYSANKKIFVIDAYTFRMLKRFGIIKDKACYNDIQKLFHEYFKTGIEDYNEYHALIVALGKTFCKPKPVCDQCPLTDICKKEMS